MAKTDKNTHTIAPGLDIRKGVDGVHRAWWWCDLYQCWVVIAAHKDRMRLSKHLTTYTLPQLKAIKASMTMRNKAQCTVDTLVSTHRLLTEAL